MADFIQDDNIAAVWNDHEPRYANSMRQAKANRDLLAGKIKAPLDASILPGESDREALRHSSSQKYDLGLTIESMIMALKQRIHREPVGMGPKAMAVATKIEMIDNAVREGCYPRHVVVDNLFNEGVAYVATYPDMDRWDRNPTLHEDPDHPESSPIKKRYSVDSKGRGPDDDYYNEPGNRRVYREHAGKSSEYFSSVEKDYRARRMPIVMQAFSCQEAVPINPRLEGGRMVVDGLVRKSEWAVSELVKKGYRWGTDQSMEPTGPDGQSGAGKTVTRYEYWGTTTSGHVYTAYSIDGLKTTKNGHAAVIDLTETRGIQQLPIAMAYGLGWAGAINPDDRPVGFPNIYGRTWLNRDSLMTSLLIRAYKENNLYRVYKPDVELLKYLGIGKGDVEMPDMQPGKIIPVLGDLSDPHSTNSLKELSVLLGALTADLQNALPSPDAMGSGSDVPGYARNVAKRDALERFQPVIDGDLSICEQSVGYANEQMHCIGKQNRPVCIFVNQDIPVEQQSTNQSSTKAIIEVDPEIFGDVWDVEAEIPVEIGDNMPLAAQLADFHDRGKIPLRLFLEKGLGIPNPDQIRAETLGEQAMAQPLGMARLNTMAATIAGDEELAAIMEGVAAQELLKLMPAGPDTPDNVVPTSMAAGVTPPHIQGAMNPAQDALQGIEAGPYVGPQNNAQQMALNQGAAGA